MIIDEETYLAHYGVKGMRWGKRRNGSDRSRSEKVKIGAAAGASFVLGSAFVTGRTLNPKLGLAAGSAAAYSGARFMQKRLDDVAEKKLKDLK